MSKIIVFTPEKAKDFAKVYNKSLDSGKFEFDGDEYIVPYAYYLIQYLVMNGFLKGKFDINKKFHVA